MTFSQEMEMNEMEWMEILFCLWELYLSSQAGLRIRIRVFWSDPDSYLKKGRKYPDTNPSNIEYFL